MENKKENSSENKPTQSANAEDSDSDSSSVLSMSLADLRLERERIDDAIHQQILARMRVEYCRHFWYLRQIQSFNQRIQDGFRRIRSFLESHGICDEQVNEILDDLENPSSDKEQESNDTSER